MSFVPTPLQASAASTNNATSKAVNSSSTSAGADTYGAADATSSEVDHVFKNRTFDVYWVDKTSLMYKDGYAKVRSFEQRRNLEVGFD